MAAEGRSWICLHEALRSPFFNRPTSKFILWKMVAGLRKLPVTACCLGRSCIERRRTSCPSNETTLLLTRSVVSSSVDHLRALLKLRALGCRHYGGDGQCPLNRVIERASDQPQFIRGVDRSRSPATPMAMPPAMMPTATPARAVKSTTWDAPAPRIYVPSRPATPTDLDRRRGCVALDWGDRHCLGRRTNS